MQGNWASKLHATWNKMRLQLKKKYKTVECKWIIFLTYVANAFPLNYCHRFICIFQPRNVFYPWERNWYRAEMISMYSFSFVCMLIVTFIKNYLSFIKTPEVIMRETSNGTRNPMAISTELNAIEKRHPKNIWDWIKFLIISWCFIQEL